MVKIRLLKVVVFDRNPKPMPRLVDIASFKAG